MRSAKFTKYDPLTQKDRRRVLNKFCQSAGALPFKAFRQEDVIRSRDKRSETPAAADKLVKYLRIMFAWAVKNPAIPVTQNPAVGVERISETVGFHTWTVEEIAAYRAHHALGTKPRLALEIMLNVGCRISDAAHIGRQHESAGWLKFTARKNRNRKSRKVIELPILLDLARALDATATGDMTYLVSDLGTPFSIERLGHLMGQWADEAGLTNCTSHGIRKAAAVALAENGATAAELCAVFGWSQLATAQIYIDEANKRKMAGNALARLEEHRGTKSVSFSGPKTTHETKNGENLD
jgi:integrase